jgi:hypothetical protein
MVVATSGSGSSISYTRIISSSSSPSYSVVDLDSKTFRDSTLGISYLLRGLFIIDKNSLVTFIWDNNYSSKIATLNLLTLTVNYQAILPRIWYMKTVIFVSASVYYTASYDYEFYKDNIYS